MNEHMQMHVLYVLNELNLRIPAAVRELVNHRIHIAADAKIDGLPFVALERNGSHYFGTLGLLNTVLGPSNRVAAAIERDGSISAFVPYPKEAKT